MVSDIHRLKSRSTRQRRPENDEDPVCTKVYVVVLSAQFTLTDVFRRSTSPLGPTLNLVKPFSSFGRSQADLTSVALR